MADNEEVNPEERRSDPEHVKTDDYEGPDRRVRAKGSVGRRHADRKGPRHRRDIWLFIVTLLVAISLNSGHNTTSQVSRDEQNQVERQKEVNIKLSNLVDTLKADEQATKASQEANTKSLCSLRSGVQKQYDAGIKFIATHPLGFAGISSDVIKANLADQATTLKALSILHCPNPKKHRR